jgi:hypothetical protein
MMWTGLFGMNRKQWSDADLTELAERLAAGLARLRNERKEAKG